MFSGGPYHSVTMSSLLAEPEQWSRGFEGKESGTAEREVEGTQVTLMKIEAGSDCTICVCVYIYI